jgi:TolB protein
VPPTPTRDASTAPVAAVPRGKIVYTIATGEAAEQHFIWIADADGTDARMIIENSNWPALSPDGKLIAYHRIKDEGIYIANIDGSGARVVVKNETCCVQWSPDGKRLMYVRGKLSIGDTKITIVNVDGTNISEIATGFNPAWAPDGNRIVYAGCQPNTTQCGLFVYDLRTKAATLITRDSGSSPQWSPRGDKIVYQASVGGGVNIFTVNPDGSGQKQLTANKGNTGQPTWSSDGNFIFYRSDQEGKEWAIFLMRADGTDKRLLIPKAAPDANLWARESLSAGP